VTRIEIAASNIFGIFVAGIEFEPDEFLIREMLELRLDGCISSVTRDWN